MKKASKSNELSKALMKKCRAERMAKTDLTIRNLAKKLEVTEGHVSAIENSRATPTHELLMDYLTSIGINTKKLIEGIEISKATSAKKTKSLASKEKVKGSISKLVENINDEETLLLIQESVKSILKIKSMAASKRKKT